LDKVAYSCHQSAANHRRSFARSVLKIEDRFAFYELGMTDKIEDINTTKKT
jgi:hypothetical protein